MAGIVVKAFQGMQPTVDPKLLPENAAQNAENTKLNSGTVRPWKEPADKKSLTLRTGETTVQTIYRFGQSETDEANYWFHWSTPRNVVKAPTYSENERTYFTGADSSSVADVSLRVTDSSLAGTSGSLPNDSRRVGLPRPARQLTITEAAPDPLEASWEYDTTTGVVTITTTAKHGYEVGTNTYINLDTDYGGLAGERYVYVKSEYVLEYKVPSAQVSSIETEESSGNYIYLNITLYEAHNLKKDSVVTGTIAGATETAFNLKDKSFLVTGDKTLRYTIENYRATSIGTSGGYLQWNTPEVLTLHDRFKVGFYGGSGYAYNGNHDVEVTASSSTGSTLRAPVTGVEIESVTTVEQPRRWLLDITMKTPHYIPRDSGRFQIQLSGMKPEFLNGRDLTAWITGDKTLRVEYPVFKVGGVTPTITAPASGTDFSFEILLDSSHGFATSLTTPLAVIMSSTSTTFNGTVEAAAYNSTKLWFAYGDKYAFTVGYKNDEYGFRDFYDYGVTTTPICAMLRALYPAYADNDLTPIGTDARATLASTIEISFAVRAELTSTSAAILKAGSPPGDGGTYWHFRPSPKATGSILATLAFPSGEQDATLKASTNATPETRYYVWTYVNEWGEEGPPSLPSNPAEIRPQFKALINLAETTTPSGYNIDKVRIYRTATGSNATDFQYVRKIDNADTSVTISNEEDAKRQSELGEVLPTTTWDMPPPILAYTSSGTVDTSSGSATESVKQKLKGLTSMANGILAGYFDNTICFSEPFQPYAWPIDYRKTLDYPITGMGAFGASLFVGTTANPYIVSGIDPAAMSMTKIETKQACVSARSVVEMGGGVIYASPDGLCLASGSGVQLLTGSILQRDDWQAYKPSSIHAAQLDGRYYAFYDTGTTQGCLILDLSGTGATLWKSSVYALAAYQDPQRDALYLVQKDGSTHKVKLWDGGTNNLTYTWRSKRFQFEKPNNLGAAQVVAKSYSSLTFKLYAVIDGSLTLMHTQTVASDSPFRLPSGYLARDYEFEISGTDEVTSVYVANSMEELKRV